MTQWQKQRSERNVRLGAGSRYASGKMVPPDSAKALLEAIIRTGVCLEGRQPEAGRFSRRRLESKRSPLVSAAALSRFAVTTASKTSPSWSTARQRYRLNARVQAGLGAPGAASRRGRLSLGLGRAFSPAGGLRSRAAPRSRGPPDNGRAPRLSAGDRLVTSRERARQAAAAQS